MIGVFPAVLWQHMMRQPYFEWPECLQMRLVSRSMYKMVPNVGEKVATWLNEYITVTIPERMPRFSPIMSAYKIWKRTNGCGHFRWGQLKRLEPYLTALEEFPTSLKHLYVLGQHLASNKLYKGRSTLRERLAAIEAGFGHEMVRYMMYAGLIQDTPSTRKRTKMNVFI